MKSTTLSRKAKVSELISKLIAAMEFLMLSLVSKQHEVFYAVVFLLVVYVMDSFFRFKIASKFLFHDKTMLKNISDITAKRMIFFHNLYVTVFCNCFSALPTRMTLRAKSFISLFLDLGHFFAVSFGSFFSGPREVVSFKPSFSGNAHPLSSFGGYGRSEKRVFFSLHIRARLAFADFCKAIKPAILSIRVFRVDDYFSAILTFLSHAFSLPQKTISRVNINLEEIGFVL